MILSESFVRGAAREQPVLESAFYNFSRFDETETYDLFISHSYSDKEFVTGIYSLFQDAGYKVYVDIIDDKALSKKSVTSEIAANIRSRISHSKALAYIATSNSTTSKWCPWELGVSDGMHGKVCVLPVTGETQFHGQEYLGLYPYLDYGIVEKTKINQFWVNDPKNPKKYTTLNNWLNNGELKVHN